MRNFGRADRGVAWPLLVVIAACVFLVGLVLTDVTTAVAVTGSAVVVGGLLLTVLWVALPTGDGADNDVWKAIPSWQYDGRHVESGGLTRHEQEQSLREIQDQAAELTEEE